ncbi:MAG: hypothetical protein ACOYN0_19970, partial [Phycisphaerales bacterium]
MNRRTHRLTPLILAAAAGLAVAPAAHAQTQDWANPVTGNWSDLTKWVALNVPDTTGENAFIGVPGGYTVYVNGDYSIGGLAIPGTAPGVQVAVTNGRTLSVLAIDNSGTITVGEGGGSGTYLRALSQVSIVGAGAIVLNASSNLETGAMYWSNNSGSQGFTNGPLHTIQGSGRIHALLT